MKTINKKITEKLILISTFLIFLSTFVNAITVTGGFRNGLLSLNNFFSGQQFQPYANAIDFFFFSLLFIAIYMMGARYAFKEVKRPEQVIVILLGLMTAFLLVLAGWSATILLPYIHWLFYILLFALWYWLLKGIKNKFWRFILALLLTLLTIWLLSLLLGGFIAPDASGFVAPFFEGLKGISFPELPGPPGIPTAITDLFSAPSTPPTGPTTLPPTPTPSERGFFDSLKDWWWLILLVLLLLAFLGLRGRKKPPKKPEGNVDEILNNIDDFTNRKRGAMDKIREAHERKIELFRDATRVQAYLNAMTEDDVAHLWEDPNRQRLREEKADFVEILEEEFKLIDGLKALREVEIEIWKALEAWAPIIAREKPTVNVRAIIDVIKQLIINKAPLTNVGHLQNQGILYLIELCANIEKRNAIISKELAEILQDGNNHIKQFIIDKFADVNKRELKWKEYVWGETFVIKELIEKIRQQIDRLNALKTALGSQQTQPTPPPTPPTPPTPIEPTPVAPPPTVHPDWPFPPQGKYDPNPPDKPVFPIKPVIPPQPEPKPSRHKEASVDLSPMFLPIGNQNNSSACGAFAGASIVEYLLNPTEGRQDFENNLSELFLWYDIRPDKSRNMGMYSMDTVPFSLTKKGICFEKLWEWNPLDATGVPTKFAIVPNPQDIVYPDALKKRVVSSRALDPNDPDSWVDELLKKNPILISIEVDEGFRNAGREKILHDTINTRSGKYHALIIVGFISNYPSKQDPKVGVPAFKIRNSWGKAWGENGYLWITYDILPQLLGDKPIVMEGPIQQEPEGQKERKLHALVLTPTNSWPKEEIEIIGKFHENGNNEVAKYLSIGNMFESKRNYHIILKDSIVIEKGEYPDLYCLIGFWNDQKDNFKISKMTKDRITTIRLINKRGDEKIVLDDWFDISKDIDEIQINEYKFKVTFKDIESLPNEEEYYRRYSEKILRLYSPKRLPPGPTPSPKTEPEPKTRTKEEWAQLAMDIFRDLNNDKNINLSSEEIGPYVDSKYQAKLVPIGPKYQKWQLAAVLFEESKGFLIPCLQNYYWKKWPNLVQKTSGYPASEIQYLYNVRGYSNLNKKPNVENFISLPEVQILYTKYQAKVGQRGDFVYKIGPPWNKGVLRN